MDRLLPLAEKIATRLIERKEYVAIAEGSAGGLISAALLAVPGASAYFMGGAVVYTGAARSAFTDISLDDMKAWAAAGEPALRGVARAAGPRAAQHHLALAEAGAAGPSGNRYGDPAGHTCIAGHGPSAVHVHVADRQQRPARQHARLCGRALELLAEQIGAK